MQHIAERIFRNVSAGRLASDYKTIMGRLIEETYDNPDFNEWVRSVNGNHVEKLIASIYLTGDIELCFYSGWLLEYIRANALRENMA